MIEKSGLIPEGFRADEILLYIKLNEDCLKEEDLSKVEDYLPVRKTPDSNQKVKMTAERVKNSKLIS